MTESDGFHISDTSCTRAPRQYIVAAILYCFFGTVFMGLCAASLMTGEKMEIDTIKMLAQDNARLAAAMEDAQDAQVAAIETTREAQGLKITHQDAQDDLRLAKERLAKAEKAVADLQQKLTAEPDNRDAINRELKAAKEKVDRLQAEVDTLAITHSYVENRFNDAEERRGEAQSNAENARQRLEDQLNAVLQVGENVENTDLERNNGAPTTNARKPSTITTNPAAGVTPSKPKKTQTSDGMVSIKSIAEMGAILPGTVGLEVITLTGNTHAIRIDWILLGDLTGISTEGGYLTIGKWNMLVVLTCSVLGAMIHASSSLAFHMNTRTLTTRWIWFLVMRAPIAVALGLCFYMLLRGGLLNSAGLQGETPLNVYGLGAMSAMVGLFTEPATNKLRDVFNTLLSPSSSPPPELKTMPVINKASPPMLLAGQDYAQVVRIEGDDFHKTDKVIIDGTVYETEFISEGELKITFTAEELADEQTLKLAVTRDVGKGPQSEPIDIPVKVPVQTADEAEDDNTGDDNTEGEAAGSSPEGGVAEGDGPEDDGPEGGNAGGVA